jgi:hypothetical protein
VVNREADQTCHLCGIKCCRLEFQIQSLFTRGDLAFEPFHLSTNQLTKQCTGVADRAESEIRIAGGNSVIVVVRRH